MSSLSSWVPIVCLKKQEEEWREASVIMWCEYWWNGMEWTQEMEQKRDQKWRKMSEKYSAMTIMTLSSFPTVQIQGWGLEVRPSPSSHYHHSTFDRVWCHTGQVDLLPSVDYIYHPCICRTFQNNSTANKLWQHLMQHVSWSSHMTLCDEEVHPGWWISPRGCRSAPLGSDSFSSCPLVWCLSRPEAVFKE